MSSGLRREGGAHDYGDGPVLHGVDLSVAAGEVHALLGINGAGKTTLVHAATGRLAPTSGSMTVDGVPVRLGGVRQALDAGVVLLAQEVDRSLVGSASVHENLTAGHPLALVEAQSTEHVSAVLRVAHRHRVPVVPQGARTGLAGGANAVDGAILVSLAAMDRVVQVDRRDQVVVVQAGVITAQLAEEVALHGLFYPPDPASADRCTIGGNIATNAGGMRCVKYGVTRDFVRALQVVLADGSVVRVRGPQAKGVAGYDLTGLFVGSEGTLGVVTEATLALLPGPGPTLGITACFADRDDALAAADDLMDLPTRPSTLEYLDATVVEAIRRFDPSAALRADARAVLIVLTDDPRLGSDDLADYRRIAGAHRAVDVRTARDAAELDALLAARRLLNPAMRAHLGERVRELQTLRAIESVLDKTDDDLFTALSPDERDQLQRLLTKIGTGTCGED